MSPNSRTSTESARPCSARKTRSISAVTESKRDTASRPGRVLERTYLDRQRDRARRLARPREGRIEIGSLEDPEAADVFLALEVRTVGDQQLLSAQAHHRGGARRVQAPAEDPGTGALQLLV